MAAPPLARSCRCRGRRPTAPSHAGAGPGRHPPGGAHCPTRLCPGLAGPAAPWPGLAARVPIVAAPPLARSCRCRGRRPTAPSRAGAGPGRHPPGGERHPLRAKADRPVIPGRRPGLAPAAAPPTCANPARPGAMLPGRAGLLSRRELRDPGAPAVPDRVPDRAIGPRLSGSLALEQRRTSFFVRYQLHRHYRRDHRRPAFRSAQARLPRHALSCPGSMTPPRALLAHATNPPLE